MAVSSIKLSVCPSNPVGNKGKFSHFFSGKAAGTSSGSGSSGAVGVSGTSSSGAGAGARSGSHRPGQSSTPTSSTPTVGRIVGFATNAESTRPSRDRDGAPEFVFRSKLFAG